MSEQILSTFGDHWVVPTTVLATPAAFSLKIDTATEPATSGAVIAFKVPFRGPDSDQKRNILVLRFFGTDANNEQVNVRVLKWRRKNVSGSEDGIWSPTVICVLTDVTFNSSLTGVSGKTPSNTQYYADTYSTITSDNSVVATKMDDVGIFELKIDPIGAEYMTVEFAGGTTPAATAGIMYHGD